MKFIISSLLIVLLAEIVFGQERSISGSSSFRRNRFSSTSGKGQSLHFNCPEDFGYYQHPDDCAMYYVCVFGGALLESCTGGLMYSNDLQTCDWPRNVVCPQSVSGGISTVKITDPRTSSRARQSISATEALSSPNLSRSLDNSIRAREPLKSAGTSVQETASRSFNAFPSAPTPKAVFPPQLPSKSSQNSNRVTTEAPNPLINNLLNLTNTDYYYYYDDILYDDYYDQPIPSTTTARSFSRTSSRGSSTRTSSKPSSGGPPQTNGRSPSRPAPTRPQPPVGVPAQKCDPTVCVLPDCYCGQAPVPGNIPPQNVPQMVLLTFDDSINDLNKKLYQELFERGRVNPNGCPIASTMYVSHEWTDYSQVQNLYSDGHEIASHSITHSFGEQFSKTKWAQEIGGQREIMSAYGGVRMEDIRGMRAPFLAVGGNNMFEMLYDLNFTYDSSMPVYENRPPSWPFTLDYKLFHDCMIPPCPTFSYPGVWSVPMVMWQDLTGGRCSMADACTTPPTAEGVYQMLIKNFERHYTTNRSPFGLFYHAAWFTTKHHKEGFIAFLDTISAMDDVWLVTNWQALQWVRNPVPLSQAKSFKPFQCDYPERPPRCTSPRVCNVWHKGSVRYLKTCQQCPESYPWTGNTGVQSPLNNI